MESTILALLALFSVSAVWLALPSIVLVVGTTLYALLWASLRVLLAPDARVNS